MEEFNLTTADNVTLAGIKNSPVEIEKCILCLHMLPATKESYLPLMKALEEVNWLAFAIDFRGHGRSTENGSLDYHTFSDLEHQQYRIDAYESLMLLGEDGEVDAVIGASIGANVSLELQVDFEIPKSVLISPGLNYRGIESLPAAKDMTQTQACYIIASHEKRKSGYDGTDEATSIYDALATPRKSLDIYPDASHGTDILVEHEDRIKKIVSFVTT